MTTPSWSATNRPFRQRKIATLPIEGVLSSCHLNHSLKFSLTCSLWSKEIEFLLQVLEPWQTKLKMLEFQRCCYYLPLHSSASALTPHFHWLQGTDGSRSQEFRFPITPMQEYHPNHPACFYQGIKYSEGCRRLRSVVSRTFHPMMKILTSHYTIGHDRICKLPFLPWLECWPTHY